MGTRTIKQMAGNLNALDQMQSDRDWEVLMPCGTEVKGRLAFERRGGKNQPDSYGHYKTHASDLFFTYPLKLMLPKHASSSNCQWVYPINYGGGIVSGDNVTLKINVKDTCCIMMTTQSSTKVYHSEGDLTSQQKLEGDVGAECVLAVLQDPVTCYAGARYKQTQTFHVDQDGSLLFMDWLTAGRIANGERWDFESYSSSNSVFYKNTLVYRDSTILEDTPLLKVHQTMQHYNVIASCMMLGPKFSDTSSSILDTYGAMQDYGSKPDPDLMIAVSPIKKSVQGDDVSGVVVKFASSSVSKVYSKVEELLTPLFAMLGGNPFQDKH